MSIVRVLSPVAIGDGPSRILAWASEAILSPVDVEVIAVIQMI